MIKYNRFFNVSMKNKESNLFRADLTNSDPASNGRVNS